MKNKPITLSEHLRRAVKARWAKTSAAERSDVARTLVAAREAKRARTRKNPSPPAKPL